MILGFPPLRSIWIVKLQRRVGSSSGEIAPSCVSPVAHQSNTCLQLAVEWQAVPIGGAKLAFRHLSGSQTDRAPEQSRGLFEESKSRVEIARPLLNPKDTGDLCRVKG